MPASGQLEEALIPLTDAERVVGRRPDDLPADAPVLPGDVAFRLHDTFGFPIDLTVELAAEYGVARRSRRASTTALAEQRERSRSGHEGRAREARRAQRRCTARSMAAPATPSSSATRRRPPRAGSSRSSATASSTSSSRPSRGRAARRGRRRAELVLDRTPFYAEGGGQVGDQGALPRGGRGSVCSRSRTPRSRSAGLIVHRGTLHGRVPSARRSTAVVDAERRAHTMRNHTGTHLLHRALRNGSASGRVRPVRS